ncbi:MAG: phospholipase D-like domain-containing protein [Candidatus Hydrogenedentota bacterium]
MGSEIDTASIRIYEMLFEDEVFFSEINNLLVTKEDKKVLENSIKKIEKQKNLAEPELEEYIKSIKKEIIKELKQKKIKVTESYRLKYRLYKLIDFSKFLFSQIPLFYLFGFIIVVFLFITLFHPEKRIRFYSLLISLLLIYITYIFFWQRLLEEIDRYIRINTYPKLNFEYPYGFYVKPLINTEYLEELTDEIRKAKKSIDISMYTITMGKELDNPVNTILKELVAAKKRGVCVRVLLENPKNPDDVLLKSNSKTQQFLKNYNIQTLWDIQERELHDKVVIIDGYTVFIGNHNLSKSALIKNNEVSIVAKSLGWDQKIFLHFKEYFSSSVSITKLPERYLPGFIKVANLRILPDGEYFWDLKESIVNAKFSIKVIMFYMATSASKEHPVRRILQELVNAKNRGIDIEVILDETMFEKNLVAYQYLREAGIKVRFDESPIMTHTKLVIVDNYKIFLGSHNWTTSAFNENYEIDVYFESYEIADQLKKLFTNIYYPQPKVKYKMDLNKASQKELELLPEIGPVFASKIIEYRKTNNGFKDKYELLNIPNFGTYRLQQVMWSVYCSQLP